MGPVDRTVPTPERLGRGFQRLWMAAGISNLGDGVRLAALPLLAATITREPGLVAGVTVALRLPWLLFAIPAGELADRFDRRRLMVLVSAGQAGVMGIFGLVVVFGPAEMLWLYVVAFLLGVGEVTYDTTAQTLIPAVVGRADLERANGRLIATERIANDLAGPPLGSLLFAFMAAAPFLLDAATFAVSALVVGTITLTSRTRVVGAPSPGRVRLLDGLRWVWSDRFWRVATLYGVGLNLAAGGIASILVLYALDTLAISEAAYGFVLGVLGGGGLLGAMTASRIRQRVGPVAVFVGGGVLQGVGYGLAGLVSNPVVVVTALGIVQFGYFAVLVVFFSLRQALVPDEILGRVTGAMRLVGAGALPAGAALGGLTAQWFGLRAPFLIASLELLLLVAVTHRPLSRYEQQA